MKILKSTAICLLSVLLTAGTVQSAAFAAKNDGCALSVYSHPATANEGDTIKVSVVLEPEAHVSAMTISLSYDPGYFEYQRDAAVGAALGECVSDINDGKAGKIALSCATTGSLYDKTKQTVMMTATFKVRRTGGVFNILPEVIGSDDFGSISITRDCAVKGMTISGRSAESSGEISVSFDASGGSGEMAAVKVDRGSAYILPECSFSAPDGAGEFAGWDKGAPGDEITVNDDLTLTVRWKEKDPSTGGKSSPVFRILPCVLLIGCAAFARHLKKRKTVK